MEYLAKDNKITAIQIKPENYQKIVDTFDGYVIQNGLLLSSDGSKKQDNMWLVCIEHDGVKVNKCLTDSLFSILFEEKPVEHFTLGELLKISNKAKKDDYPDGDYVEWNGYTWVTHMSGVTQLFVPTPQELMEKCWLPA